MPFACRRPESRQSWRSFLSAGFQLLLAALVLCGPVRAEAKTITVVAGAWGDFTKADGSGLYFDVLRAALAQSDIELKIRVTNWKRAKQMFYAGRADVLLADFRAGSDRRFVPEWHLDMDPPVLIFSLQQVTDLQALRGKTVGWMLGYDFGDYLPVAVNGVEVSAEKFGFDMLLYGRLDAYISYQDNVPDELRTQLKHRQLAAAQALYPVFQNTFAGRQLAADFDRGMQQLYRGGRLQQLYGPHYRQAGFPPASDKPHPGTSALTSPASGFAPRPVPAALSSL